MIKTKIKIGAIESIKYLIGKINIKCEVEEHNVYLTIDSDKFRFDNDLLTSNELSKEVNLDLIIKQLQVFKNHFIFIEAVNEHSIYVIKNITFEKLENP